MQKISDKAKELYEKKPGLVKFGLIVALMLVAGYFYNE